MDLDLYPEQTQPSAIMTKRRFLPFVAFFERTARTFSPGERLVLYVLTIIFLLSTFSLVAAANAAVSVTVPTRGGTITEGVVGPVRFINPLLALSAPDKDMTALIYSGLMRATPEGALIPDLAEKVEISEDGTTYTFTLRSDLTFHDGEELTSADVLFTIQTAQNPDIKSSRRADWEGVTVAVPDPRTVVFVLPHAYAPFLENATIGILPKHLWKDVSAEEFPFSTLNMHPVGSGPYKVSDFKTNATGAATEYTLSSFKDFTLGQAFINKFRFLFYPNEEELIEAFNAGRIDTIAALSPAGTTRITNSGINVTKVPLPRVFGIFFNQNKNPVLADVAVRAALDAALDKQQIVDEVLLGYGTVLEGPVPPGILGTVIPATPEAMSNPISHEPSSDNIEEARAILARNDWVWSDENQVWKKKDVVLSFTLATVDEPALAETAEHAAKMWREAGIQVDVHVYPISELNSVVLRPRAYEAVLFGEVVGRTLDLFAFWHSSQRNDPGLNIALYTNARVDDLLAKARATTDKAEREKLYEQFIKEVAEDRPAVFLYTPTFVYFTPEKLKGVELGALTGAAERFLNVHEWHVDTEKVWRIFTDTTKN